MTKLEITLAVVFISLFLYIIHRHFFLLRLRLSSIEKSNLYALYFSLVDTYDYIYSISKITEQSVTDKIYRCSLENDMPYYRDKIKEFSSLIEAQFKMCTSLKNNELYDEKNDCTFFIDVLNSIQERLGTFDYYFNSGYTVFMEHYSKDMDSDIKLFLFYKREFLMIIKEIYK